MVLHQVVVKAEAEHTHLENRLEMQTIQLLVPHMKERTLQTIPMKEFLI